MSALTFLSSLAGDSDHSPFDDDDFAYYLRPNYRQHYHYYPGLQFSIPASQLMKRAKNRTQNEGKSVSQIGKDGFQVCMDVQQFMPNEITVKTVDNTVVVEGKHEEREDEHGYISRHFVRRYPLPKGYDPKQTVSTLSSDGVLTIRVPNPAKKEGSGNERIVQIQQTGPAHLSVKENPKLENKSSKQ